MNLYESISMMLCPWLQDHELLPGHLPVLVYELEDTEAIRAFAAGSDAAADAADAAARRVCPEDGKVKLGRVLGGHNIVIRCHKNIYSII